jgi:hypothetical protein
MADCNESRLAESLIEPGIGTEMSAVVPLFKGYTVPGNHSLVESEPGLRTVPLDEFSDCVIVGPL